MLQPRELLAHQGNDSVAVQPDGLGITAAESHRIGPRGERGIVARLDRGKLPFRNPRGQGDVGDRLARSNPCPRQLRPGTFEGQLRLLFFVFNHFDPGGTTIFAICCPASRTIKVCRVKSTEIA